MGSSKKKDPLLQTHYEVLGLSQQCSFKDVRDAFVKLSKKVHPDLNPDDPTCHQSFLKLREAYSILSKPDKRQTYDANLMNQKYVSQPYNSFSSSWVETNAPFGKINEWRDETLWSSRDKSKDKHYEKKAYYGVHGVARVSNRFIAAGCVLFMLCGAAFHYVIVKSSAAKAIEILNNKDQDNLNWYLETRRKALESGNHIQLERLSEEWKKNHRDE